MKSPAIYRFRRAQVERHIEELIALLDVLDGDPDFEESGDADWSGYEEELPTRQWKGQGVADALRMIAGSPAASARADGYVDAPRIPLVYDFRNATR